MKRNFKYLFVMSIVIILALALAGCSKTSTPKDTGNTNTNTANSSKPAEPEKVNYPTKPIQVIVPAGAGGPSDIGARIVAKYLEKELGQPIAIVNVTGAGGSTASRQVKDAKADGYTVMYQHTGLLVNQLTGIVDYTYSDFALGGTILADNSYGFLVNKQAGKFKDLADFMAQAKANPGKLIYATETGSVSNLMGLAFEKATGADLNIADIGSDSKKIVALKANQVDVMPGLYGANKGYLESGDFQYLGLVGAEPVPTLPDFKTFKQKGVDFTFPGFTWGFFFPKDTPQQVVEKFTQALEKVSKNPELKQETDKLNYDIAYKTPEQASTYWKGIQDYINQFKNDMTAK